MALLDKNAVVTFKISLPGFADLTLDFWDLGDGHEKFFFLSFTRSCDCLWRHETTIFSVKSIMGLVKESLLFGMGDPRKNK